MRVTGILLVLSLIVGCNKTTKIKNNNLKIVEIKEIDEITQNAAYYECKDTILWGLDSVEFCKYFNEENELLCKINIYKPNKSLSGPYTIFHKNGSIHVTGYFVFGANAGAQEYFADNGERIGAIDWYYDKNADLDSKSKINQYVILNDGEIDTVKSQFYNFQKPQNTTFGDTITVKLYQHLEILSDSLVLVTDNNSDLIPLKGFSIKFSNKEFIQLRFVLSNKRKQNFIGFLRNLNDLSDFRHIQLEIDID